MKTLSKNTKKPIKNTKDKPQQKDQYLIVVSIIEGRNFQKRNGHNLIIEARLDGELMSTDEVEHIEHPYINTELAWEVDRESLRIFRMQRIPIKLQCFAVDPKLGTKEFIGFVVLDLRLLHPKPQSLKWYPLLHNKYHWMKSELYIGFYLEKDFGKVKQEQIKSSDAKQKKLFPVSSTELAFDQPVLNEDEGYYQLGPPSNCKDIFSLSLTIVFAENLTQLIPSDIHLPKEHDGFYFFYILFGNDVTTDTFPDLISPSFAAERATVRIRSSLEILQRFLASHPDLQVHLCVGDISLGCASIPLNKLLPKDGKGILKKPVAIEKTFQIKPLKGDVASFAKNSPAIVGLSLCLKLTDKVSEREMVIKEPEILNENKSSLSSSSEVLSKPQDDSVSPYSNSPPIRLATRKQSDNNTKSYSSLEDLFEIDSKLTKDKAVSNTTTDSEIKKPNSLNSPRLQAGRDSPYKNIVNPVSNLLDNDAVRDTSDVVLHHYCFIVDVRYLRLHSVKNSIFCFLRYSYPFFGTSASIFTYPPVEIRGNSQVTLPHGFCAFTFAAGSDQLTMALQNLPLQIELVQRDKQKNKDIIIGMVSLDLGLTLKVNKSRITTEDKKIGYRQTASIETSVANSEGASIGDLYVVMSLDDFGVINLDAQNRKQQDPQSQAPVMDNKYEADAASVAFPSQGSSLRMGESKRTISSNSFGGPSESKPYSELHKQMAVQVAKELQEWKSIQQDYFNKELAEKETQYLETLAIEWRKRETEREMLYQRRITECENMQEKLQKALFDIDKRERTLSIREQELQHSKTDFDEKCERHEKEIKLGYLRMQEDFNHRLQLEKEKAQEIENQKLKLEAQITELGKKLEAKIQEFELYREEQRNNPEMRLQSEVHLLALEKSELERKLEAAVKSKVHYKQQWGRCLRELARIKQKMEADARAQLYKQQQELESMRLQYLATEGKEDNSVLQEIKGDLNIIKENVSKNKSEERENIPTKNLHIFLDSDVESDTDSDRVNIERLKREREALLQTGVYNQDDRIIRELDRQIKETVLRKIS